MTGPTPRVHLVGAGPGDPGLLTCRGAQLIGEADVIIHDRLVDQRLLELAHPAARRVDLASLVAGAGRQETVNELLVAEARDGARVVRLKGGDPFVLGRGSEEAQALEAAGIAYEIVPGVSSAFAVPAAAGTPVTHRGLAGSVSVLTGHDLGLGATDELAGGVPAGAGGVSPGGAGSGSGSDGPTADGTDGDPDPGEGAIPPGVRLEHLARAGGTLVVLMGGATHRRLAERLLAAGRPPGTPVLVVERGTTPEQASWRGDLAALAAGAAPAEPASPALIVVGAVAGLALASYEDRPLAGWRVVVTRPAGEQSAALAGALAAAGARPIELPVIEIAPPADGGAALAAAARRLGEFDWVVLTSANAVAPLFDQLHDARDLASARVAAIGTATAAALAERGVAADLVPPHYVAESLLEAFPPAAPPAAAGAARHVVLLPRAAGAREVLPDGLRRLGYDVEVVEAYRTLHPPLSDRQLDQLATADAVTFTSSSTVRGFLALAGPERLPPVVVSIGPVTSATARQLDVHVDAEAEVSTVAGLVEALTAWAGAHGRPGGWAPTGAGTAR